MKKWITMLLVLVMLFSLAACSAKEPEQKDAAPAEATADAAETTETAQPEADAEDGQNPIMNFVGVYACDRASILVEATDQADGVKFTVTWGSSAAEHSEWVMTGKFDAEKLTVAYEDCTRTDIVFKEDGTVDSETVVYENGTGTITFSDADGLTLTWDDAMEHMADDMVFEYAV